MKYPKTLEDLIFFYNQLPGIGEKSAERMALATLKMEKEQLKQFGETIGKLEETIKKCKQCNNIAEKDLCLVCSDQERNKKIICVVEDVKKVIMIEKIGKYNGLYYVLEDSISPLKGMDKVDLIINPLIKRLKEERTEELMFALKLSIEGETTIAYIQKLLDGEKIVITKIAQGIPHGVDIEYIDSLTLERAIDERKTI